MKTNSKEVKTKVLNHIIEFVEEWDNADTIKNKVIDQIDYMKNTREDIYQTCIRLVQGCTFLIYDEDIREFIDSLELNNNSNKKFDNMQVFNMYCMLLARELETIYNSSK